MGRHRLAVNARVPVVVPRKLLQEVLQKTIRRYGPTGASTETSVAFVSPQAMANLNRVYRGKRGATDVLSFSFYRGERSPLSPQLLGEVIIAPSVAALRAERYGHALRIEVALLFLHGLLHVLGMEHEGSAVAKRRMRAAEAAVARTVPALRKAHVEEGLLVRELVRPLP